ncbi:hypothetical protein ACFRCW_39245 [Streptomyces sp. NPDC056653]|uniref:hypothetical protein n=1 Tax=Streptomyces sp. NPDC056653 TaxID=3345894 RepID=UPI0036CEE850
MEFGKVPLEAFVPQIHQPRQEAEVDFGDVTVRLAVGRVLGLGRASRTFHIRQPQRQRAGIGSRTTRRDGTAVMASLSVRRRYLPRPPPVATT